MPKSVGSSTTKKRCRARDEGTNRRAERLRRIDEDHAETREASRPRGSTLSGSSENDCVVAIDELEERDAVEPVRAIGDEPTRAASSTRNASNSSAMPAPPGEVGVDYGGIAFSRIARVSSRRASRARAAFGADEERDRRIAHRLVPTVMAGGEEPDAPGSTT